MGRKSPFVFLFFVTHKPTTIKKGITLWFYILSVNPFIYLSTILLSTVYSTTIYGNLRYILLLSTVYSIYSNNYTQTWSRKGREWA